MCSFVGHELRFLKLGLVLVAFSGGVSNFSWKPTQPNCCFWGQLWILLCRMELRRSHGKSMCEVFTYFVCVLKMWLDYGWNLSEGAYFSWGTIIFLALRGRGNVWSFCQCCVHFGFAHLAVHMIKRFVIQGVSYQCWNGDLTYSCASKPYSIFTMGCFLHFSSWRVWFSPIPMVLGMKRTVQNLIFNFVVLQHILCIHSISMATEFLYNTDWHLSKRLCVVFLAPIYTRPL